MEATRSLQARLAIRRLEASGDTSPQALDAFIAEHDFPIVEDTTVTFVYRGRADAVNLRHWVYGLPSSQPFQRLGRTDLWYFILDLPSNSRVEYKLEIVEHGHHQWIEDPLNPLRARDPFGANSVAHSQGYEIPEWISEDPEGRQGHLEEVQFRSQAFGRVVPLQLYVPARFRKTRRYPLLVVHDGTDYVNYAAMKVVLDNLIRRLEIPDMMVALIDSPQRMKEYTNHVAHSRFVVDELVPMLEKNFPLDPRPEARALVGASLGAVASFTTAWRYPGFFSRLLLQSGSFAFSDIGTVTDAGPAIERVAEFVNAYRDQPIAVAEKVFVSCGTYESLIYENRSLVPLLTETGMDVRYVESRDGHNWENWRDRLREGLSFLFPGPLWMVYE